VRRADLKGRVIKGKKKGSEKGQYRRTGSFLGGRGGPRPRACREDLLNEGRRSAKGELGGVRKGTRKRLKGTTVILPHLVLRVKTGNPPGVFGSVRPWNLLKVQRAEGEGGGKAVTFKRKEMFLFIGVGYRGKVRS